MKSTGTRVEDWLRWSDFGSLLDIQRRGRAGMVLALLELRRARCVYRRARSEMSVCLRVLARTGYLAPVTRLESRLATAAREWTRAENRVYSLFE